MSGSKKVSKDHYLFREGDPSDAMYVIKSGKFAVVKTKAAVEIVLAEIGPGAMVGEMAFFDDKPRSASVKSIKDGSEVIVLPFKALRAQFVSFPEWAKAIMRTVNDNLRNANKRLKELESGSANDDQLFPPHTITKLVSILNLVAHKYGKSETDGLVIPGGILRNYTIQVFQEATHKMQKMMNVLAELGYMTVEDLGEGRQRVVLKKPGELFGFAEWFNEWLFKREDDRVSLRDEEILMLNGFLHFGKNLQNNDKGLRKLNLNYIQSESPRELGYLIRVEEVATLVEKKIVSEQMMEEKGVFIHINYDDIKTLYTNWSIVSSLRKITRAD
jgi:CRP/FNR family cyclic AMP-dependent transcriptional regulator